MRSGPRSALRGRATVCCSGARLLHGAATIDLERRAVYEYCSILAGSLDRPLVIERLPSQIPLFLYHHHHSHRDQKLFDRPLVIESCHRDLRGLHQADWF